MFEFSKLVTSPPLNLILLLNKHLSSASTITRRNYSQKGKKNRPKPKEKSNVILQKQKKFGEMNNKNISSLTRVWDSTKMKQTLNSDHMEGTKFIVMSYNILAQDLLETHIDLYKNNNKHDLNWDQRIVRLAAEILTIRPNILCLQEVQDNHLEMILNSLKALDFDYVFKKKTGDKTDGCAILFNRNQFCMIKSHTIEYHQSEVERLDRPNIALAVKLSLNQNPLSTLLVVTTHLLYNPRRQDVRLAQVQVLLAEIDMLSFNGYSNSKDNEPKRIPIILTGDFNFQPYSAPYRLLQAGILHYNNLTKNRLDHPEDCNSILTDKVFLPQNLGITDNCQHIDLLLSKYKSSSRLNNSDYDKSTESKEDINHNQHSHWFSSGRLTHKLDLASVYKHISKDGIDKEASTYQDEWITVDYIFYNTAKYPIEESMIDGNLKLLSWYLLPSIKECEKIRCIPNSQIGSDHLALAAEFYYSHSKI